MDFVHTETASTSASPGDVWALWSDASAWSAWDPAVERVVLDGPFRLGTTGTMRLVGGEQAPFTLVAVSPDARCCVELVLGELHVRVDHRVERQGAPGGRGASLSIETTVAGPGAAEVGPSLAAQAAEALSRLVAQAEDRAAALEERVSG